MSNTEHTEHFNATAIGSGWPTAVSITDTRWTFQLDEPTEDGGSDSGPNPMHHFVASLAGCQNEQAQVVAEEMGFQATRIEMTVEVALDLAGFMGVAPSSDGAYKQVTIAAAVAGLTDDQARALGANVDARCPILALLRTSGAEIRSEWTATPTPDA